jgi:hypothetical protein
MPNSYIAIGFGENYYMNTLEVFSGKQKEYNTRVLTLLYDNCPLSTWVLACKISYENRNSLNATLSKRLQSLQKKEYVRKDQNSKWNLRLKGIVANLLIQPKPKMWNPIWTEIFTRRLKSIEHISKPILDFNNDKMQKYLKFTGLEFDDFQTWIDFTEVTKRLLNSGLLNFDIIKETTLMVLIISEAKSLEEMTNLLHPGDSKPGSTK